MEIGKEDSNVQNAQLSMQELYGKTQEPPHKKVPLTEKAFITIYVIWKNWGLK